MKSNWIPTETELDSHCYLVYACHSQILLPYHHPIIHKPSRFIIAQELGGSSSRCFDAATACRRRTEIATNLSPQHRFCRFPISFSSSWAMMNSFSCNSRGGGNKLWNYITLIILQVARGLINNHNSGTLYALVLIRYIMSESPLIDNAMPTG